MLLRNVQVTHNVISCIFYTCTSIQEIDSVNKGGRSVYNVTGTAKSKLIKHSENNKSDKISPANNNHQPTWWKPNELHSVNLVVLIECKSTNKNNKMHKAQKVLL